jgi:hypothetical protein
VLVELAFDDLLSGLYDQRGAMRVEQSEVMIRLRGGPFDQPKARINGRVKR